MKPRRRDELKGKNENEQRRRIKGERIPESVYGVRGRGRERPALECEARNLQ